MRQVFAFHFVALKCFALVLVLPVCVGALDQTSARCVVAGNRQAKCGVVGKIKLALHETFAEGRLADDQTAIPVLNGAGDDFAGRRGPIGNKKNQGSFFELAVGTGIIFFTDVCPAPLRIDHHAGTAFHVAVQEHIRHLHRLVEISARIAPKIQDQSLHPLCLQFLERCTHFFCGCLHESIDADVARFIVEHHRNFHTIERNDIANDFKIQETGVPNAENADRYFRSLRPAQMLHHGIICEPLCPLSIDADDFVVRQDTDLRTGAAADCFDHRDRVIHNSERDTDTFELSLEILRYFF